MGTQDKSYKTAESAGKRGRPSRDWFKIHIWPVQRMARVFWTNHSEIKQKTTTPDYFRLSIEICFIIAYHNYFCWVIFIFNFVERMARICFLFERKLGRWEEWLDLTGWSMRKSSRVDKNFDFSPIDASLAFSIFRTAREKLKQNVKPRCYR